LVPPKGQTFKFQCHFGTSKSALRHQFAKGDPGYQLQAGDAYFREGPFINDFAEISPGTLFGLGGNNATSFSSFGAFADRESSQRVATGGDSIVRAIEAIALAKNPHENISHSANYRDHCNGVSRTNRGSKKNENGPRFRAPKWDAFRQAVGRLPGQPA
jgi:hypothetical protein